MPVARILVGATMPLLDGDPLMNAKSNKATSPDPGMSRKERRAAERAARKSGGSGSTSANSKRSVPLIAGGAIVIGILVVLVLVFAGGGIGDSGSTVTAADAPPPPEELQHGRSLGDPDAPVKIEVFEDPQCPACGLYNKNIEPLLRAGPITRGEVFLTYKDMAFLGPESFDGAAAMRVAEALDGKFWEYHDVIFHNQDGENQGAFATSRLADMAELVGLDREAFIAELEDPEYIDAVQAETAEARVLGVTSTPTLVINGELRPGVPNWDELSAEIAAAVNDAAA